MTSKVDETRQVAAALQPNEAIVVLKKPQLEGVGTEEDFLDCLQENLGGELVHPEQGQTSRCRRTSRTFHSRSTASRNSRTRCSRGSSRALRRPMPPGSRRCWSVPGVAERLAEIGVRYVVWLDGNTKKTDGGGSVACAAGPGGAGCIGIGWWEKHSDYVASVWDLQSALEMGSVTHRRQRHVRADRRDRPDPDHLPGALDTPATGWQSSCARSWSATIWRARPRLRARASGGGSTGTR